MCIPNIIYLLIPVCYSAGLKSLCVFQISELALEVAVLFYGGHLVVTGQMSSSALISFFIYVLEVGECLEVFHQFY